MPTLTGAQQCQVDGDPANAPNSSHFQGQAPCPPGMDRGTRNTGAVREDVLSAIDQFIQGLFNSLVNWLK